MAIIIDANRAGDFGPSHAALAPEIMRRIAERQMFVVAGGNLLRELFQTNLRNLLVEWTRAGRVKRVDDISVEAEEKQIKLKKILSDDPHILALARISGCRLLYTDDSNLIKDFKNLNLIKPKGKVVKSDTRIDVALSLFNKLGA